MCYQFPLPREPKQSYIGLSYRDYILKIQQDRPLYNLYQNPSGFSSTTVFNNRLQYYIDTVKDFSVFKKDILLLWRVLFRILKSDKNLDINGYLSTQLFPLISITGEALIEKSQLEKLDVQLKDLVHDSFETNYFNEKSFAKDVCGFINWYTFRQKYLRYWGLTSTTGDISIYERIHDKHQVDLQALKSTSPSIYLQFIEVIKNAYHNTETSYRLKFKNYFLQSCLEQIQVAKNSGIFTNYKKYLEDYYKEKFSSRKIVWKMYDCFTGYGEEPWRLIVAFFAINLLFSILFSLFEFDFNNISQDYSYFCRLFNFFYFSNTTMLTVGFGDIYPVGVGAKIMVLFLQIIGFTISTSTVALYLKKLFRY